MLQIFVTFLNFVVFGQHCVKLGLVTCVSNLDIEDFSIGVYLFRRKSKRVREGEVETEI